MEERLLGVLRQEPGEAHLFDDLLDKAGVSQKKAKEAKRTLKGLVKRGLVERERGRRYRLSRAGQTLEGKVTLDERGMPVVWPDGPKELVTPITVLTEDADDVEAGDRARVELVVRGRQGQHFGRLVEVLDRPASLHIGLFRQEGNASFVEIPDEQASKGRRRVTHEVIVPEDARGGARDGEMVQVELTAKQPARARTGKVVKVIGEPGARDTELMQLMMAHGLDKVFPKEVEAEAAAFGDAPSEADIEGRRDVRDLPLVTIDGETAKDFDDAVCVVKGKRGYTLYVAIADVSHYVRPGTALDKEARTRGTSTYLTDRAIPMLPEALSNGLCSLVPKQDRLCFLAQLSIDNVGHVTDASFHRAVMRSKARLTYTRVAQALDGAPPDEETERLLPQLILLARVAAKLLQRRLKRGAIDLDLPEPEIRFDESGEPIASKRRPRNDAHRLIEDLMLAANEAVARFFAQRDLPCIYRVHEDPDPERLATFVGLCEHLGLRARVSERPRPAEIAQLIERLDDHPFGKPLHGLLLRSLAQAKYDAENKGHYGLAAEHYLHFTSPIRRYPDLVVHRLLGQVVAGDKPKAGDEPLEVTAESCSELERKATQAERASLELDRALIAQKHLGDVHEATISGVQGFGLFCALDDPYLDGLVPVQTLPSDYYELDDFGALLVGKDSGRQYMVGQRVQVEIASVNISRRQVELRLAPDPDDDDDAHDRPRSPKSGHKKGKEGGRPKSRERLSAKKGKARGKPKPAAKGRAKGRGGAEGGRGGAEGGRSGAKPRGGRKGRSGRRR